MTDTSYQSAGRGARPENVLGGIATIVLVGVLLGVSYNALGQRAKRPWGMAWRGVDRAAQMPSLAEIESGPAGAAPTEANPYLTHVDDPMAVPAGAGGGGVPVVPDLDRPIEVAIDAVRRFVDAGAALIVDVREPDEYAEGHIPGSINLPYDEVATDPVRLETLESGGRPVIVYCGGGSCELSMNMAYELILAGHKRVLVYTGGFPEWETAGNPVDRAERQGG